MPCLHPSLRVALAVSICLAPIAQAAPAPPDTPPAPPARPAKTPGPRGYFRFPALHGDRLVFTAEGDLWQVSVAGGMAERLTSHPAEESNAAFSPDGTRLAFSAEYEGPRDVYVIPASGGVPVRCTYGANATVVGWMADGKVIYRTTRYATLPDAQLCTVDPDTFARARLPLSQASDGVHSPDGSLYFTRLNFQGSQTKRYQGGTVQNLWRWRKNEREATPLTGDFAGTSRSPMFWNGRVYFASDRDGTMNIWSMNADGKDLHQHTRHEDFDVLSPSLSRGRIAYQCGADVYLLDLHSGKTGPVSVRLPSDFDQMRERWVKTPREWITSAHLSPDGSQVALTARGQVWVAPARQGRLVEATRRKLTRYREARFAGDGKSLLALSDESGEVELWRLGVRGLRSEQPEQLTRGGTILRWDSFPSPDGKWIAHTDKANRLHLYDVNAKIDKTLVTSREDRISDITWSPDSRYIAFAEGAATSGMVQIKLYDTRTAQTISATSDRYSSYSPAFSPDGDFLYFLSDRHFSSVVGSPWGERQPEPFFDRQSQVFYLALRPGLRPPFQPDDELSADAEKAKEEKAKANAAENKPTEAASKPDDKKAEDAKTPKPVTIAADGLMARVGVAPVPPGNYGNLIAAGKRLFFLSSPSAGTDGPPSLKTLEIKSENPRVENVLDGVRTYELSGDGKKILARKDDNFYVFNATGNAPNLDETRITALDGWTFAFDPKEEWRQMFEDSWRLHRDYFYATNMHGVNWPTLRDKYRPLSERVTDRAELSDVLAQMMGELSVLHTFVGGGDVRPNPDSVAVASLGALWERDAGRGGWRITKLFESDPDEPETCGPLMRPGVEIQVGDVIAEINGQATLDAPAPEMLLRSQVGRQVRLRVFPDGDSARAREVIVVPLGNDRDLRYRDWELSRRRLTDKLSNDGIGYVHLRAMGTEDIAQWQRDYYPIYRRQGLIVDVRHNNGGNIDSWILEKLLRKPWMYWNNPRTEPYWNMQYAFRGPVVVLCDESTASDGEAFAEGFRRLKLGKLIGTRTWGGEVWLTSSNRLVDNGIATAAEFGVFGPEGKWLIEGRGVEPDIVVDNLPRATFDGKDAQLEAAIKYLQDELRRNPIPKITVPAFPDKSLRPRKKQP